VDPRLLKAPFDKLVEAKAHTPVYMMHKYFARRPWNVFNELISHYSSPNEIVLDPFCGGGVTLVESLKLGRRTVGVDINPLATYVTKMQIKPVDLDSFRESFNEIRTIAMHEISALYATRCENCGEQATPDWIEWDEQACRILRLKYNCKKCGRTSEKQPSQADMRLAQEAESHLASAVKQRKLWYPKTAIPQGDKTSSLLNLGIKYFHELFTPRNLLALSLLLNEIEGVHDKDAREFLKFTFSSSLKWSSRQSHLRGQIVEGWAMHAYWIYPKSLEINVWNTFQRRFNAVLRGKKYSNGNIGVGLKQTRNFSDITNLDASCLLLSRSATRLPLPSHSVDVIITDPPYGGNVNYGELSDFWFIWMSKGKTIPKKNEIVINRTQRKSLSEYERLLNEVFRECHRVLKPHRQLVSTFNSRDMRVVASFITAVSEAGFVLVPDGVLYQKPIRPYTTTFHAMQIGAFVGDFIFTFQNERRSRPTSSSDHDLVRAKKQLLTAIEEAAKTRMIEPKLRENAYRILIPFLATYADTERRKCEEAVDFFETQMTGFKPQFRELRKIITVERRRNFAKQNPESSHN
jgi:adenine-specific DNA methylase